MIDPKDITCCLISKDPQYPLQILQHIGTFGFGEILVLNNSDSPYRKHELFAKAKHDLIYYQDDDAICPILELLQRSLPDRINVAMKPEHYSSYEHSRATMGLGWGSIFPKRLLESLKKYTDAYGEDALFKRETERILTYLNFPQNRMVLPIADLPSAYAEDRLWRQPEHFSNIPLVENRCSKLL